MPQLIRESGYSLSAPGGGEGRGEVGDSRALADTHLTLPRLGRGPLPLPPEGRRGFADKPLAGAGPGQLGKVLLRRETRGNRFLGVFVAQFVEAEAAAPGNLQRALECIPVAAEQPRHLRRRL